MKRILAIRVFADAALITALFVSLISFDYRFEMLAGAFLLLASLLFGLYLLIHWGKIRRPGYLTQVQRFKAEAGLLAAGLIVALTVGRMAAFERFAVPFVMVYLVLSIFLLRTYRHLDYHRSNRQLDSLNFKYAAVVLVFLVILSIGPVRTAIINVIVHSIMLLTYFIVMGLVYAFVSLVKLMAFKPNINYPSGIMQGLGPRTIEQLPSSNFKFFTLPQPLVMALKGVAIAAAAALLLWLIVKIFKALYPGINTRPFVESREFLTPSKDDGSIKPTVHRRKAVVGKAIVREYYAKFLRLLKTLQFGIKEGDTTLEISRKYGEVYTSQKADKLRALYIGVRYHDEPVGKAQAEQCARLYKEIKNETRRNTKAGA